MTIQPLVSIIIPSYNHAVYVERCIDSVIAQDYANIELIVIDDGSRDDSVHVIKAMATKCQQRFVRFELRVRPNKGLPATMNEGLYWGQGKYFSYISSDDLMLPDKTSRLVDAMESHSNIAGAFCGAVTIDEVSGARGLRCEPAETICEFSDLFLHKKSLVASSMLLDMASVKAVGGYDESNYFEDWYMWLKLTEHGRSLLVIPDALVTYRIHPENMSKNIEMMQDGRIKVANNYNQHRLYPFVMARIYAASALEWSQVSRPKTFRYIMKSMGFSLKVIFTRNFRYALAKTLLPKPLISVVKRFAA